MEDKHLKSIKVLCVSLLFISGLLLFVVQVGSSPSFTTANIIGDSISWARDIYPYDIDQDGDMDVFSVRQDNDIETPSGFTGWYENNSDGTFTYHEIDDPSGMTLCARDFNGDGYPEVVVTRYRAGTLDFYNCEGDPEGIWTKTTLASGFNVAYICWIADMDNDGDYDVIADAWSSGVVKWFENDGAMSFTAHTALSQTMVRGLAVGDIDGDGWNDIVTSYDNAHLRWYRNDQTPSDGGWAGTDIGSPNAVTIACADIDGDGDIDVACPSNSVGTFLWWENENNGATWTSHTIDSGLDSPRVCYPVDIDDDGDMDVIGAIESTPGTVKWYENANGIGTSWTAHIVTNTFTGYATDCNAVDFDYDGDMDILACDKGSTGTGTNPSVNDASFVWFEQEGSPVTPVIDAPEFVSIGGNVHTNETLYDSTPEFVWTNATNATGYWLQVATDIGFSSIIINISDINEENFPLQYSDNSTEVHFILPGAYTLVVYQQYFTRVKALTAR